MKQQLQTLLLRAAETVIAANGVDLPALPTVQIEPPRNPAHGDYSSNIAMLLAKPSRMPPLEIARQIVSALAPAPFLARVEVVAPGFINFHLREDAMLDVLVDVLAAGDRYGRASFGNGQRIQVEFVSANPTGPLHVGHGRGAAYGAVLANLLGAVGYDVVKEYYVNDAGRQMDILALSVWLRYLQQQGCAVELPSNAYQGEYVIEIANGLAQSHGGRFLHEQPPVRNTATAEQDADRALDEAIAACRNYLGETRYEEIHCYARTAILAGIKQDLLDFGVEFDNWYSERSLVESRRVESALSELRSRGHLYLRDGAEWFRSSDLGDEKDRVVIRENGIATYFASDIAYHADKFARGFAQVIDIWGADHHGYIPRVKAALTALGADPARLEILLVQFATLYRHGEKVQMSTRSGEFVTLKQLLEDVGRDAARFFYITRRSDQHLDFDLDLAKSQSQDNPVYYIQYAHARICSVFKQLEGQAYKFEPDSGLETRALLVEKKELVLVNCLMRYPNVIEAAAQNREPHAVATYLKELATEFHAYYNAHKILIDNLSLRKARLALILATKTVLSNGLGLLGVAAPTEM